MKIQHQKSKDKWAKMSIAEQMANIGTEVGRAITWKNKKRQDYSQMAFERALELLAFTKMAHKDYGILKEVCRVYELFADYFQGDNAYQMKDEDWEKYFNNFLYLSAKTRSL